MTVKMHISDGVGSSLKAEVSNYNALYVAQRIPDVLPAGEPNRYRFYSALLGSTGAGSGVTNMNVNGAVTSQTFYISAHNDYDLHIMAVVIIIADSAIVHSAFGNVGALGVGWDLKVREAGQETFLIEKAKTGGQVIAQAGFHNSYGADASSFELTNWTGITDAQTIYLPIGTYVPGGIRIGRGTLDRISSVVNDDLTGLTEFYTRVIGYRHYD